MSDWLPISELASGVASGTISARSLVEKSLKNIEQKADYCALISVLGQPALQKADEIDAQVKTGEKVGKLAGVPFIAKDNFLTFNCKTTAASKMLEFFEAPYQATVIEKLEAEGAILVAKANLDAFAHGSSTENSAFGPTLNPHDKTRVPGGSSGGSAAAVALGLAPFALGTDTGGSIRLPASYCGVVGMKPTYGLVSRYGVVAMASSTDAVGPLTNSVDDAAIVLDIISGKDSLDSTTINRPPAPYDHLTPNLKGKKIGVIKEYFTDGLDKSVKTITLNSIEHLKKLGAEVDEVSLPSIDLALACYYVIAPAEVSSNLSRYDGQRFGLSAPAASDLNDSYQTARENGFADENKRRIMIGTYVLSSGFYDDYYKKAQTVRTKLINEFNDVFKNVDYLVGPTAPTAAFKLGDNVSDPLQMYLADIMTVAANLVGIPAISLPAGQTGSLPVGLQLMAPQNHDKQLLQAAKAFEGVVK